MSVFAGPLPGLVKSADKAAPIKNGKCRIQHNSVDAAMTREFVLPWPSSINHYYRHVGLKVLISKDGRLYRERIVNMLKSKDIPAFTLCNNGYAVIIWKMQNQQYGQCSQQFVEDLFSLLAR